MNKKAFESLQPFKDNMAEAVTSDLYLLGTELVKSPLCLIS
jgi:hypothetical protein